jgi:hypothetical protein
MHFVRDISRSILIICPEYTASCLYDFDGIRSADPAPFSSARLLICQIATGCNKTSGSRVRAPDDGISRVGLTARFSMTRHG